MNKKQYLLNLAKAITKHTNMNYTLTPDHLYIHNKKRLHKSKIIGRFDLSDDASLELSDDGGKTWITTLRNGDILCPYQKSNSRIKRIWGADYDDSSI